MMIERINVENGDELIPLQEPLPYNENRWFTHTNCIATSFFSPIPITALKPCKVKTNPHSILEIKPSSFKRLEQQGLAYYNGNHNTSINYPLAIKNLTSAAQKGSSTAIKKLNELRVTLDSLIFLLVRNIPLPENDLSLCKACKDYIVDKIKEDHGTDLTILRNALDPHTQLGNIVNYQKKKLGFFEKILCCTSVKEDSTTKELILLITDLDREHRARFG